MSALATKKFGPKWSSQDKVNDPSLAFLGVGGQLRRRLHYLLEHPGGGGRGERLFRTECPLRSTSWVLLPWASSPSLASSAAVGLLLSFQAFRSFVQLSIFCR